MEYQDYTYEMDLYNEASDYVNTDHALFILMGRKFEQYLVLSPSLLLANTKVWWQN